MPSFLEKSEVNFACAEHLFGQEKYLCNSIAHYYYSVLQLMMEIVAVNEMQNGKPKTGAQMFADAGQANTTSHKHIQNRCIHGFYSGKCTARELKDTKAKIINLKKLRTKLEYNEDDVTNEAQKARDLAIELRNKFSKYAQN